jgi:hypothetical protein
VGARQLDGGLELLLVRVAVIVYPGPDGNVDSVSLRELRNVSQRAGSAVATNRVDFAGKQLEVRIDLGVGGQNVMGRVFAGVEGLEGKPLDARGPGRLGGRPIQESPDSTCQGSESRCDHQAG